MLQQFPPYKHDTPRGCPTLEEVANLVAYVCSPLASATNGAALRVDGGVVRSMV
jgi:enoyl-[acyl-carrier-protein] reductase (NADH)